MSNGAIATVSQGAAALTEATNSLAIDSKGLSSLKRSAHDNSPEAIRGVAKQFEAIFLGMMLKSMRDATPNDGPLENEQSRTFTTMLDQQLTQNLVGKGVGLADVLVKQLTKLQGSPPVPNEANTGATGQATANPSSAAGAVSPVSRGSASVQPEISLMFSGHMLSRSLAKLSNYTQAQQARAESSSWYKGSANAYSGSHVSEFTARMLKKSAPAPASQLFLCWLRLRSNPVGGAVNSNIRTVHRRIIFLASKPLKTGAVALSMR